MSPKAHDMPECCILNILVKITYHHGQAAIPVAGKNKNSKTPTIKNFEAKLASLYYLVGAVNAPGYVTNKGVPILNSDVWAHLILPKLNSKR